MDDHILVTIATSLGIDPDSPLEEILDRIHALRTKSGEFMPVTGMSSVRDPKEFALDAEEPQNPPTDFEGATMVSAPRGHDWKPGVGAVRQGKDAPDPAPIGTYEDEKAS